MTSNKASGSGQAAPSTDNGEERLDVHGTWPAITRVSRRAVLLACIFGASLGLVILVLGFGGRDAPRRDGPSDENAVRYSGPIESVKDLPKDYTFDVNRLGQTYGGPSPSPSATRPAGPSPQELALAQAVRDLGEQRRKLLDQQQKEQQAALDSPLLFGGAKSTVPSTATTTRAPVPATMPTFVMPEPDAHRTTVMAGAGSGDQSAGAPGGTSRNRQGEKDVFLTQAAAVEPYLSKPLLNPISEHEIKAGSVIPGALVTGINTDLPGDVIGQVTENVYDSATGDHLLIPQGARLLGKYQSLVTNGQNRALLVWQRLVYPNGRSIALDGMPGTDQAGQAGLKDQVDYHLDKLVQAAALTTAIAYGGNLARNPRGGGGGGGYGGQDAVGDTVAQQANRVGEKIIDRELDVQPTITIRQGWPLRVLVNKDMILQPYVP
jgi:type IV secretory pathway VirB10-like protein